MSLPDIQVEGRIETMNSLIVYRVRTIKRFLIPMKNLFWNPLMSCDIMGRQAGVIIVLALPPRLHEEYSCLVRPASHLCLHTPRRV